MGEHNMISGYDREEELQLRLNSFLRLNLGLTKDDYYSRLDLDGFLGLKTVLSDINNILTLKVALAFTDWITAHLGLSKALIDKINSQILGTKPNANGYDIELTDPVKLIAEVKCNIPINGGNVYGSAQKNGIAKDINGLINGKNKSSINPYDYLKFMVFLDKPEIRKATRHFVKNMREGKESITFIEDSSKIETTENIYVAFVEF